MISYSRKHPKLFFSCNLNDSQRSEVPKLGNSSGHNSSNIYREQKLFSDKSVKEF
jgi:hypothetical protein